MLFKDPFHDAFGSWPLAYIPFGGADYGEIAAVARDVGDGDDGAFHRAWMSAGGRIEREAQTYAARGLHAQARQLFLRSAAFFATSYHPLYGEPVDPRVVNAFQKQKSALNTGLALSDHPSIPLQIPFEGHMLPGHFIPAEGREAEVRPLLILTNGYDATQTDMYFASAVAASRRGYHSLIFDGPGQGGALIEQCLRLRPDWETVIKAVVDVAIALPLVDPRRIALSGWSLGGYLAARAASGEPRLAACIADPGLWGIADAFRASAIQMGASTDAAQNLADLDESLLDRIWQAVNADRKLRWSVVQRGFWVHGVDNLRDFLRAAELFTIRGRAGLIQCPTLIAAAENDPLSSTAQAVFEDLRCPKALLHFTATEGADGHCEMGNRSLANRRILDWLDGTLA